MSFKIFLPFCGIALFQVGLYAQPIPVTSSFGTNYSAGSYIVPQVLSPEASSLCSADLTPVMLYDGSAQIDIPLTELHAHGTSIPISASYTTGGVRLVDHPGWLGHGWTLHAGGCINRIVRGTKDEQSLAEAQYIYPIQAGSITDLQSYYNIFSLQAPGYLYHANMAQGRDWVNDYYSVDSLFNYPGIIDFEPDEFHVDYDGISGTFYFGADGIKVVPREGHSYRVEYTLETEDTPYLFWQSSDEQLYVRRFTYIKAFVITSDDGVKYTFGADESAIDFSYTYDKHGVGQRLIGTANTWFIKRIDFPGGESILFSYEKEGYPVVVTDVNSRLCVRGSVSTSGDILSGIYFSDSYSYYTDDRDYDDLTEEGGCSNLSYTFLHPSYLQQIRSTHTGDVVLFNRARSYALGYYAEAQKIRWQYGDMKRNAEDAFDIEDYLYYDYFCRLDKIITSHGDILFSQTEQYDFSGGISPRTSVEVEPIRSVRLRLESISFQNEGIGTDRIYSFSYIGQPLTIGFTSKSADHWGYFSGHNYGYVLSRSYGIYHLLSPCANDSFFAETVDAAYQEARAPATNGATQGALKTIIYPTGGSTTIQYEPHEYHREYNLNGLNPSHGIAGGLRIKEIVDSTENYVRRRSYNYNQSGILSRKPKYGIVGEVINIDTLRDISSSRWDGLLGLSWDSLNVYNVARFRYATEHDLRYSPITEGQHVTYSHVTETLSDSTRIDYEFSNYDTAPDEPPMELYHTFDCSALIDPYTSLSHRRGLLKRKTVKDSLGAIISSELYIYEFKSVDDPLYTVNKNVLHKTLKRVSVNKIYLETPRVTKMVVADYGTSRTDSCVVTKSYSYDDYFRQKRVVHKCGSDSLVTRTIFSGNLTAPVYSVMNARGMTGVPIERITETNGRIIGAKLIKYGENVFSGTPSDTLYLPKATYDAKLGAGIASGAFNLFDGVHCDIHYGRPSAQFTDWDSHGNLKSHKDKSGTVTSYIWDSAKQNLKGVFTGAENGQRTYYTYAPEEETDIHEFPSDENGADRFYFTSMYGGPVEVYFAPSSGSGSSFWWRLDGGVEHFYTYPYGISSDPEEDNSSEEVFSLDSLSAGTHYFELTTLSGNYPPVEEEGEANIGADGDPLPSVVGQIYITYQGESQTEHVVPAEEFYYEDFESSGDTTDGWGDSEHCQTAPYQFAFSPSPGRRFIVDYREKANGSNEWIYHCDTLLLNNGICSIGETGSLIDEIRVYPSDANIVTARYGSFFKPESITDTRGVTSFYEYDSFGRLACVYDNLGQKLDEYDYHHVSRYDTTEEEITDEFKETLSGNYLWSKHYVSEDGSSHNNTVSFIDGLGRPFQTMRHRAAGLSGGLEGDLLDMTEYDSGGRKYKEWLPVARYGGEGGPVSLADYYGLSLDNYNIGALSDSCAFSFTRYQSSLNDREIEKTGAGQAWHRNGKSHHTDYLFNVSSGNSILTAQRFIASVSGQLDYTVTHLGVWPDGSLSIIKSEDEDGTTMLVFSDFKGLKILERRLLDDANGNSDCLDTYFIYDTADRLLIASPPLLSEVITNSSPAELQAALDNYAFMYRYDNGGRVIASKIPGAAWIYNIYDIGDRLVLSQNGNQRAQGIWGWTAADIQGRTCLSGLTNKSFDVFNGQLQSPVIAQRDYSNAYTRFHGYDISGIDLSSGAVVHDVVWWDDYDFIGKEIGMDASTYGYTPPLGYDGMYYGSASGSITGSISTSPSLSVHFPTNPDGSQGEEVELDEDEVEDVEDENNIPKLLSGEIKNSFYYDDKRQQIQSHKRYPSGIVTSEYDAYDFDGNLVKKKKILKNYLGDSLATEEYNYSFDNWGRLLSVRHFLGENAVPVQLDSLEYSPLGRIYKRNACLPFAATYGYNTRGWTESIDGTLFHEDIWFNSPRLDVLTPRWNGAISSIGWRSGPATAITSMYDYSYDTLTRLTSANYGATGTSLDFSCAYGYDVNGNILSASRQGGTVLWSHSGNKVQTQTAGDEITYYVYDACGNIRAHLADNTITGIRDTLSLTRYNYSGLPVSHREGEDETWYSYSSSGEKISKRESVGGGSVTKTTDYYGDYIFEGDSLVMILTDMGYIDTKGTNAVYRWFINDHLGNVRVVAGQDGTVYQINDYDPYGNEIVVGTNPQNVTTDTTRVYNPFKYSGKEWDARLGKYDFMARYHSPSLHRFTTPDPLAADYPWLSPYAYCAGDPVNSIDLLGEAWAPVYSPNYNGVISGFSWVEESESYDNNGNLLPGLYRQAIFFTDEGTFNATSDRNLGSSIAYVFLADGSIQLFDACTRPSNINNYPTIPENLYEASVGMHRGEYIALKMYDVGKSLANNTIELGTENPAYHDGRTYAAGINIHKSGKEKITGKGNQIISAGCMLIDLSQWKLFIDIFNTKTHRRDVVGVAISRHPQDALFKYCLYPRPPFSLTKP